MSLKDLTKEQKQYIVLGCLGAVILLILVVLGIRFSMASVTSAKEELEDLSGKIEKADQSLGRSQQIGKEYADTVSLLRDYLQNAPPERNYYSWATEVIYSSARTVGLEIESIDEISVSQAIPANPDAAGISLEAYSLRVIAHGGYESTKYFVTQLKRDYPLVRFSGVEISAGQSPETHDVQLFLQWPFNFGAISKNWDAIASKQRKVDASGPVAERIPSSKVEPAVVAPKREPYPPTTKPGDDALPTPKPPVEKTSSEPEVAQEANPTSTGAPHAAAPKPATESEIMQLLSGNVPQVQKLSDAEARDEAVEQKLDAESAANAANKPLVEAVDEPSVLPVVEPVAEPEVESVSEPSPMLPLETAAEPVVAAQEQPVAEPIASVDEEPVVEPVAEPVVEAVLESVPMQQPETAAEPVVAAQEEPVEEPIVVVDEEPIVESRDATALESATETLSIDSSPASEATPMVAASQKTESDPKPADSVLDDALGMGSDYNEIADLSSTIQAPAPEEESSPTEEPAPQPEKVTEPEVAAGDQTNRTYVTTGKSEKIIRDMLEKDDDQGNDASLGSFLNDLMEELND